MESRVKVHYHSENLLATIYKALEAAKKDPSRLKPEDLKPVDQLHTGGIRATLGLLEKADLMPGSEVLDAGCGIGGSSRLMAKSFGHMVTGLDLSDQFISTARSLTEKVHLSDQVYFQQGSILNIPFENASFDAILCQHVLMNIFDKKTAFKEFGRVLRKTGKLICHEVVKGENDPVMYPVPWADQDNISFLDNWDVMELMIEKAGFKKRCSSDTTQQAALWWEKAKKACILEDDSQTVLGPQLVFGENAAQFNKTMNYNLKWKRIHVIEAVFERC